MIVVRIQSEELDITPEIDRKLAGIAYEYRESFRRGVDASEPAGRAGVYQGKPVTHSAPEQFPAIISGKLYRDINVAKKGDLHYQVTFAAPYAGFVERRRPFLEKTRDLLVQKFL